MQQYILQRIVLMVPTLIGVTLVVFLMLRFVPGDIVQQVAGENAVLTPEAREDIEERLGIDQPWYIQYWDWFGGLFRGDFGESFITDRAVGAELKERLPATIELGVLALSVSLIIAVPVGVLAALRQDSWLDYVARSSAIGFLAIPSFWLATLVIVLPSKWWGVAPPIQYVDLWVDPWENLKIMLFPFGKFVPVGPAIILGVGISGAVLRLTRTQMLEVLRQDYIRTARSKGLRERTVLVRHALRNALIPVITVIGLQLPIIIGGTVLLESIFNVPGLGRYLVRSLGSLDYPVVQGINLLVAAAVVSSNLVVDVTYAYLDPRIRYR